MLPVVLLLALWFAVNLGVGAATMLRSRPGARPTTARPATARRAPIDARTSTTWTYSHTL